MAERQMPGDNGNPPNYEETREPQNPPNSMLSRSTRRMALWSYLGPVVVLFLIVGLGLVYWSYRGPSLRERDTTQEGIGTTGESPGGFEPQSRANSTRDEIERRTGGDLPQGSLPQLHDKTPLTSIDQIVKSPNEAAGRPVELKDVEVESAQGNTFWIRDGGDKVEVIAQPGSTTPAKGTDVHIVGTVEAVGADRARIRASSVTTD
jgi:hypothetical protein